MNESSRADAGSPAAYLDSSALVKLVVSEAETRAMVDFVRAQRVVVSSVIAEVEVGRAVRRATSSPSAFRRMHEIFERIWLIGLTAEIRLRAALLEPSGLRSLDAIHLATALDLEDSVDCFVVYDTVLARAARRIGLEVVSPR